MTDCLNLHYLIDRHPATVTLNTTVMAAVSAMTEMGVSCILVVQYHDATEYSLVGTLTERDLIRISLLGTPLNQLTMGMVINQPAITLLESALADIEGVLSTFQQHRLDYLPVVDKSDRVVGLLAHRTLITFLAQEALQSGSQKLELTHIGNSTNQLHTGPAAGNWALPKVLEELRTVEENLQQNHLYLEQERQKYLDLFNFAPDGYCVTTLTGIIQSANQAIATQLGIEQDNLVGKPFSLFVASSDSLLFHCQIDQPWLPNQKKTWEIMLQPRLGQAFPAEVSVGIHGNRNVPSTLLWSVRDISKRKQTEQQLHNLIEGTAATTGEDFFPALTSHLAMALNVAYAVVAVKIEEKLRILAFWANGSLQPTFEYSIDQTPCEQSLKHGYFHCESLIQQRFPNDLDLINMAAESYLGVALHNRQKEVIGNLCILDKQPIFDPQQATNLLKVFAARAEAELEREQAAQALARFNQELEQRIVARTIELQNSRRFIQQIADASPNILYLYDLQKKQTLYVNREMTTVLGYTPAEVQQMGTELVSKIVHPDDLSRLMDYHQQLQIAQDAEIFEFEYRVRNAQGQYHWFFSRDSVFLRDAHGDVQQIVGSIQDITERKNLETEQQQLLTTLEASTAELLQATRLKDEFLATMSHELRTPLNAILGLSEAMVEEVFGPITDRQQKSIATIERSGRHLLALINDILEVSKIEAGKLELEITTVSVADLYNASLAFVKQQAAKKQIQLVTAINSPMNNIAVDERRIRQVLINLLDNAVKFTPQGGQVTLGAQIEILEGKSWLQLMVIDTGIGIAPENQSKLFKPFVQIEASLNRQYAGTGLGLALVKQIVELHQGSISLTSTVGQGSCFVVRLPYAEQNILNMTETSHPIRVTHPLEAVAATQSTIPSVPVNSPLILLAEDNQDNIDTISSYLEACNYRLIVAEDGEAVIALTRAHQPDLILMDIQMPKMDGLEAMRQIRQDPQLTTLPIIALTALAMAGDQEKCLAAGANKYMTKPVKLRQLKGLIQSLIAKQDQNSPNIYN